MGTGLTYVITIGGCVLFVFFVAGIAAVLYWWGKRGEEARRRARAEQASDAD